jgi:hypothetical protein
MRDVPLMVGAERNHRCRVSSLSRSNMSAFTAGRAHAAWWALLVGNSTAFVSAMTYDRIVRAIGPFEWSEYLGLAVIYASLAVTARSSQARGRFGPGPARQRPAGRGARPATRDQGASA